MRISFKNGLAFEKHYSLEKALEISSRVALEMSTD
jgi:hypothetical protein